MTPITYKGHDYCRCCGWSVLPWYQGHYVKLDLELFVQLARVKP
jgi:hypothetical protein